MREELYNLFGGACLVAALLIAGRGARRRAHFWLWAVLCCLLFAALHLLLHFRLLPPAPDAARGAAELAFVFASAVITAWAVFPGGPVAALFYANVALCTLGTARQLFRFAFAAWAYDAGWWNVLLCALCCAIPLLALGLAVRRTPFPPPESLSVPLFSVLILAAWFFFDVVCMQAAGMLRELHLLIAVGAAAVFFLLALLQGVLAALRAAERELAALRQTQARGARQREREQESADLINIRSHDLKYRMLRAREGAAEAAPAEDAALGEALDVYERTYHTGCDALDVLLTEKSLLCREKGIELNCMADGALLSRLAEADVYTLLGNILDNAIEATAPLEAAKRVIALNIERRRAFALIREENYFAGALTFAGGLPRTTKGGGLHGYGLRSVRKTAQKYGGALSCEAVEDRFVLKVVFPL